MAMLLWRIHLWSSDPKCYGGYSWKNWKKIQMRYWQERLIVACQLELSLSPKSKLCTFCMEQFVDKEECVRIPSFTGRGEYMHILLTTRLILKKMVIGAIKKKKGLQTRYIWEQVPQLDENGVKTQTQWEIMGASTCWPIEAKRKCLEVCENRGKIM